MNSAPRRIFLFLACAVALLAAGFAWGSSHAYNQFHSPEASLERELIHLDFNGRVLHFVNQAEPQECRRELIHRLQQQMTLAASLLPDAAPDAREDAAHHLQTAKREMETLPSTTVSQR